MWNKVLTRTAKRWSAITSNLIGGIINWYDGYADKRAISMTTKVLSQMSDEELSDIGITRGDIYLVARGKCGRTLV